MDPNCGASQPPITDYTKPIAKEGEQQFAAIIRNRSGMDAGCIDMGIRDISHLSNRDKQEAVNSAYAVYEAFCRQTGKIARCREGKYDISQDFADALIALYHASKNIGVDYAVRK